MRDLRSLRTTELSATCLFNSSHATEQQKPKTAEKQETRGETATDQQLQTVTTFS
jgi:hypothetical protein